MCSRDNPNIDIDGKRFLVAESRYSESSLSGGHLEGAGLERCPCVSCSFRPRVSIACTKGYLQRPKQCHDQDNSVQHGFNGCGSDKLGISFLQVYTWTGFFGVHSIGVPEANRPGATSSPAGDVRWGVRLVYTFESMVGIHTGRWQSALQHLNSVRMCVSS